MCVKQQAVKDEGHTVLAINTCAKLTGRKVLLQNY